MKIQCDVCEKAPASVICCADEAALCAKCDEQVHAANKLASKHQRLLLIHCNNTFSNSSNYSNNNNNPPPPSCDICREKPGFIFCVEDRALFCQDCDEPIHSASRLASTHQRFLSTGIRVGVAPLPNSNSHCSNNNLNPKQDHDPNPINPISQTHVQQQPQLNFTRSPPAHAPWAVDDDDDYFLHFDKKESMEFRDLEWLTEFGDYDQVSQEAAAMVVPQLRPPIWNNNRATKSNKPRIDISIDQDDDYDECFKVPEI